MGSGWLNCRLLRGLVPCGPSVTIWFSSMEGNGDLVKSGWLELTEPKLMEWLLEGVGGSNSTE